MPRRCAARYTAAVRRAALLLLTGCGRLSFDATGEPGGVTDARMDALADAAAPACGTSVHDEDGDGLFDACDPCPHLIGGAADADGDGVGDLCDPTADATERIAQFDPFVTQLPAWSTVVVGPAPAPAWGLDVMTLQARGTVIDATQIPAPTHENVEIVGQITAVDQGPHALAIRVLEAGGVRQFTCEMRVNGGTGSFGLLYTTDGTTFMPVAGVGFTPPLTGDVRLTMENLAPGVRCRAMIGSQEKIVSNLLPVTIGNDALAIRAEGLDVTLTSFVRIERP